MGCFGEAPMSERGERYQQALVAAYWSSNGANCALAKGFGSFAFVSFVMNKSWPVACAF
jgi:hypothetical protein